MPMTMTARTARSTNFSPGGRLSTRACTVPMRCAGARPALRGDRLHLDPAPQPRARRRRRRAKRSVLSSRSARSRPPASATSASDRRAGHPRPPAAGPAAMRAGAGRRHNHPARPPRPPPTGARPPAAPAARPFSPQGGSSQSRIARPGDPPARVGPARVALRAYPARVAGSRGEPYGRAPRSWRACYTGGLR